MFLLSSGCRIGEALNLKKEDIELDEMHPEATIRTRTLKPVNPGKFSSAQRQGMRLKNG